MHYIYFDEWRQLLNFTQFYTSMYHSLGKYNCNIYALFYFK
jgi:hypothetical protein